MTIKSRVSTSFDLKIITPKIFSQFESTYYCEQHINQHFIRSKNGDKAFNFPYMELMGLDLRYYMGNDKKIESWFSQEYFLHVKYW